MHCFVAGGVGEWLLRPALAFQSRAGSWLTPNVDDDRDVPRPRPSGTPVFLLALVAGLIVILAGVCGGVFWTSRSARMEEERLAAEAAAAAAELAADDLKKEARRRG